MGTGIPFPPRSIDVAVPPPVAASINVGPSGRICLLPGSTLRASSHGPAWRRGRRWSPSRVSAWALGDSGVAGPKSAACIEFGRGPRPGAAAAVCWLHAGHVGMPAAAGEAGRGRAAGPGPGRPVAARGPGPGAVHVTGSLRAWLALVNRAEAAAVLACDGDLQRAGLAGSRFDSS